MTGIHIPSSLWIDGEDVHRRLDERRLRGELDDETAAGLAHFADHGYLVFSLDVEPELFEQLKADVDGCWLNKPADLAYAYDGPARRMSYADAERERRSRSRIHDLHSHSQAALALYLNRQIFDWIELIAGTDAVAIQSLAFEYGSRQTLHRDAVVVPTGAPGHLIAAWIALEDISPDCGPLVYVPGSHRLPCFETAPGEYEFDARRMGPETVEKGLAWEAKQEHRHGLEPRLFTAARGQVLLWHAALRHGGSEVVDENLTRRSFVVHYSTRSTYDRRSISIAEPTAEGERWQILETQELLERDGCRGFQNPMLGHETTTDSGA